MQIRWGYFLLEEQRDVLAWLIGDIILFSQMRTFSTKIICHFQLDFMVFMAV